jgi:hypothetical protein
MRTTFVIILAALVAVGVTTAIMSSGVPVYAQSTASSTQSGHSTLTTTCTTAGCSTTSTRSGYQSESSSGDGVNFSEKGGGHSTVTINPDGTFTTNKCVGSPVYKAQNFCP